MNKSKEERRAFLLTFTIFLVLLSVGCQVMMNYIPWLFITIASLLSTLYEYKTVLIPICKTNNKGRRTVVWRTPRPKSQDI